MEPSCSRVKYFLDSVHGTIKIPSEYCDKIIDTRYFQRLRRIEQNSCRSVFPCARHDRFVHSLGVFHLGQRIVNSIKEKNREHFPEEADKVFRSYEIACLLHDVGHTPFSHTFEKFFCVDNIISCFKQRFGENFEKDLDILPKKPANHEYISAYVSLIAFEYVLDNEFKIDLELFVRMIIGNKYQNNNGNGNFSFANAMIELIHGDTIDADGLDYICRDAWAGGYRNFTVDMERLISSIEIDCAKNNKGIYEYRVVYNSKALNEIETALNVKNFQQLYVLNHHKVLLEQYLLVEAMKSAACYHYEEVNNDEETRTKAIEKLCNYKIYEEVLPITKHNYNLHLPSDDDFVILMKLCKQEDYYIKQWFSREYEIIPLWKSKIEYFNAFKDFSKENDDIINILQSPKCKKFICEKFNLDNNQVIVKGVEFSLRKLKEGINIKLNDEVKPYSELNYEGISVKSSEVKFCYMYVSKELDKKAVIQVLKKYLREELQNLQNKINLT